MEYAVSGAYLFDRIPASSRDNRGRDVTVAGGCGRRLKGPHEAGVVKRGCKEEEHIGSVVRLGCDLSEDTDQVARG
jgi:hypothetical protein